MIFYIKTQELNMDIKNQKVYSIIYVIYVWKTFMFDGTIVGGAQTYSIFVKVQKKLIKMMEI